MEGNKKPSTLEIIMGKIQKNENGCWIWSGAKSGGDGREEYKYGYINLRGKVCRVHRVLYEITREKIPGGMILLHKCDIPLCVNPDHMFVGTHKDNMDDMIIKERMFHPNGECNHSKLTESEVIEIKNNKADSNASLSRKYGVSATHISNIKNGKKWAHLNEF